MPPLPGRYWLLIRPQAPLSCLCLILQDIQRLITRIPRIDPSHPRPQLLCACILAIALDVCHCAAVAVLGRRSDRGMHLGAQTGQRLFAALTKWLSFFWGVDFRQPHFDLLVESRLAATGRQGVAVSNGNDQAEEDGAQLLYKCQIELLGINSKSILQRPSRLNHVFHRGFIFTS